MKDISSTEVITAADAETWQDWLQTHHETAPEIWIAIAKKHTGIASVRPEEAIEVALCFGWIDSHRLALDETHFLQRYSPRRRGSRWSDINLATAERLIDSGRMRPAGLRALARVRPEVLPADSGA